MATTYTKEIKRTLCWICDRKLYAGGRSWIWGKYDDGTLDGAYKPIHKSCAKAESVEVMEDEDASITRRDV